MSRNMRIKLKYLTEDMDRHGNVRIYFRRPGQPKIRIHSPIGTPDFVEEYNNALEGAAAPLPNLKTSLKQGSLAWLLSKYYECAEWKKLSPRTSYVRKKTFEKLCEKNGDKPIALIEPRHIRKIRDEKSETPEAANSILKALRQVFRWAVEVNYMQTNPAKEVPYLKGSSEGFHTWTIEEVEQFEAAHPIGTKARLALALMLYTGVRRSDVVRLGPQMIKEETLSFVEMKGQTILKKSRILPILPELRDVINSTPSIQMVFLVTEFGKPFTANGFGNWFRKRCNEAGLIHCSAHGLRKAGATIAAENGATEHELMAIFGWESPKQAANYTKKANRTKLARSGMPRMVPERKGN